MPTAADLFCLHVGLGPPNMNCIQIRPPLPTIDSSGSVSSSLRQRLPFKVSLALLLSFSSVKLQLASSTAADSERALRNIESKILSPLLKTIKPASRISFYCALWAHPGVLIHFVAVQFYLHLDPRRYSGLLCSFGPPPSYFPRRRPGPHDDVDDTSGSSLVSAACSCIGPEAGISATFLAASWTIRKLLGPQDTAVPY